MTHPIATLIAAIAMLAGGCAAQPVGPAERLSEAPERLVRPASPDGVGRTIETVERTLDPETFEIVLTGYGADGERESRFRIGAGQRSLGRMRTEIGDDSITEYRVDDDRARLQLEIDGSRSTYTIGPEPRDIDMPALVDALDEEGLPLLAAHLEWQEVIADFGPALVETETPYSSWSGTAGTVLDPNVCISPSCGVFCLAHCRALKLAPYIGIWSRTYSTLRWYCSPTLRGADPLFAAICEYLFAHAQAACEDVCEYVCTDESRGCDCTLGGGSYCIDDHTCYDDPSRCCGSLSRYCDSVGACVSTYEPCPPPDCGGDTWCEARGRCVPRGTCETVTSCFSPQIRCDRLSRCATADTCYDTGDSGCFGAYIYCPSTGACATPSACCGPARQWCDLEGECAPIGCCGASSFTSTGACGSSGGGGGEDGGGGGGGVIAGEGDCSSDDDCGTNQYCSSSCGSAHCFDLECDCW